MLAMLGDSSAAILPLFAAAGVGPVAYNRRVANLLINVLAPAAKRARISVLASPITQADVVAGVIGVELGVFSEGQLRAAWRKRWEAIH